MTERTHMITLIPFLCPGEAFHVQSETARRVIYAMDLSSMQKRQCVLIHTRTARVFTTLVHADELLPGGESYHLFFRDLPYLLLLPASTDQWTVYDVLGSLVLVDLDEFVRDFPAFLHHPHVRAARKGTDPSSVLQYDLPVGDQVIQVSALEWNYHPFVHSEILHLLIDLVSDIFPSASALTFDELFQIWHSNATCKPVFDRSCVTRDTVKWMLEAAMFEYCVDVGRVRDGREWVTELHRLIPLFDRDSV